MTMPMQPPAPQGATLGMSDLAAAALRRIGGAPGGGAGGGVPGRGGVLPGEPAAGPQASLPPQILAILAQLMGGQ